MRQHLVRLAFARPQYAATKQTGLMSPTQSLSAALCALPGVEQTRSRFGHPEHPAWRVGRREFAHLHADDVIDLRLPAEV